MEYKIILAYVAIIVEIISYAIYFRSIYRNEAKPHAFTWFVWAILNVVGFAAVIVAGGEAGSWVLGVNAIACFAIAGVGFYQRHVDYDLYDWLALFGALIGAFLWWITKNPLYAVILVSLSDCLAFSLTIRKAYKFPFEENVSSFAVGILYYILAIIALENYSVTTWLYHAVIILLDTTLVATILMRRKTIS